MGPQRPTKGNAQLTRQNDISSTLFKLVYPLARESLKCNSLVEKMCNFLQKETSHYQSSLALVPQGPRHYIFGDHFYLKNVRKLKFHVFLLFYVRKHMISLFYLKWIRFTRNFPLTHHVESTSIRRWYYVDNAKTNFHVASAYFFRCDFAGWKVYVVSTYFFWRNFEG